MHAGEPKQERGLLPPPQTPPHPTPASLHADEQEQERELYRQLANEARVERAAAEAARVDRVRVTLLLGACHHRAGGSSPLQLLPQQVLASIMQLVLQPDPVSGRSDTA